VLVMIVGSAGAWFAFWVIAHGGAHTPRHLNLV
jgi:permease of the major facilitator family protein